VKKNSYFVEDTDRYHFDFTECTIAKGWAQVDTTQDASYYGAWINPTKREFIRFAEGDVDHYTFEDDTEMVAFIAEFKDGGRMLGIDPGPGSVLPSECIAHGLEPYFHPA
jgi:hypothetical protein